VNPSVPNGALHRALQHRLVVRRPREESAAIWIPVSAPHDDLVCIEVDSLQAEPRALEPPEPAAIPGHGHEPQPPVQPVDHRLHLGPAQHNGQDLGRLCTHDPIEGREIQREQAPVQ